MPRGPRIKVYEENELFEAASYIRTLEGDRPHDERENVLKQIKKIFTLRRAEVASKFATLTFTGVVCNTQARLEAFFHDLHRSHWRITVTAYVGDYTKSITDIEYCLYIGFPHFMDWVKSVIPYKKNLPLGPGQNAASELWYETESGKKFISQMTEIGFTSVVDSKYGYSSPLKLGKKAHDKIVPLVYSDDIGHFRVSDNDQNITGDVRIKMKGKEPTVWLCSSVADIMEKQFNCPVHIFDPDHAVEPDKFVEEVKKLLKFNEDRIDKLAADNGGLTWRGIDFHTHYSDKCARPYDFDKLPKKDQERINEHLAKLAENRMDEYDHFFTTSKFANLYNYIKEHGRVAPYPNQFGNEHHIEFEVPIVLDEPINYGESFKQRNVSVTGEIYVKDKECKSWSWSGDGESFYPDSIRMYIPLCYYTDKGAFTSWEEAIAAGSNTDYGGACYIQGCKVPRGKNNYSSVCFNEYWHDDQCIDAEELKRFEHVLMNLKADHEQFLVDRHYKEKADG